MKKLLTILLLLTAFVWKTNAQSCANPQSQIDIHPNKIQARILDGGDLFTDLTSAQFFPDPDPNSLDNPATIYAAGLWMGGLDPAGNLKLAGSTYRSNSKFDYSAGPLSFDGNTDAFTCANWDRHFRVTRQQVQNFLAALPLSPAQLKSQFPAIAGWPAAGNAYFSSIYGYDLPFTTQFLAPFHDADLDGVYDPLKGDYPCVILRGKPEFVPTETIWCVFNDNGNIHSSTGGQAFRTEIQLTVWGFKDPAHPEIDQALFSSHKIVNRGTENVDSAFIGIWVDADLGCYMDDYIGCNPSLGSMFAYNTDAVDGQPGNSCQGTPTFPGAAPVQSVTFLSHPMASFSTIANQSVANPPLGTTDPSLPIEYYRYLSGSWKDGSPVTVGGNGYGGSTTTKYLFPDDPSNPNGWSMCTANLPSGDLRMLGSVKLGQLLPGQVEELDVAWAFHPNPGLPCGLGSTFDDIEVIKNAFDNGFSDFSLNAREQISEQCQLFPNPTSSAFTLQYGELNPLELQIFDASGRLAMAKASGFDTGNTQVTTTTLPNGLYTIRLICEEGIAAKKLSIVK